MKHYQLVHVLLGCLLLAFFATHTAPVIGAAAISARDRAARSAFGPPASLDEPSDPLFADEWALDHVGANCAWQSTIGSAGVTVAVVDSGVDMGHPDLVERLRGDGYDFVDDDDDPSDENGHGTNVAGIVGATIDNAEGGAGLAPGVSILPVRVMNAKGFGSDRSIARGIRYAADKGAQVINLSLGATLTIGADTASEAVSSAIVYAQEQGALVVVAAGNDFVPLPNAIVGDNSNALIVAATDEFDVKADFSNSGAWIGVAAPGVHILSTMPTYEVYLTSDAVPPEERFQQNYDYMSGTSQATPLVSALAALLFSAHPDWQAEQVSQAIKDHAADISQQNRRLSAKGFLGSGRIDACA
ncbi:MAG TPA: S8 family serine peptidase, partial [Roseiflexaceae bacterium]|nr:S8 family serine peptidase [Roseiflexaceae bacterium]